MENKMSQVAQNIGCENQECIAKDDCKRQEIVKNGSAVAIP
jgi:hypothetical protein